MQHARLLRPATRMCAPRASFSDPVLSQCSPCLGPTYFRPPAPPRACVESRLLSVHPSQLCCAPVSLASYTGLVPTRSFRNGYRSFRNGYCCSYQYGRAPSIRLIPSQDDCSFHPCVRYSRFEKDKVWGSPLPRHRDWAHPCHGCIGTGPTPPHLRRDCYSSRLQPFDPPRSTLQVGL